MVDYIPLLEFLCDIVNGEVDFFHKLIGLRLGFLGDLIFVDYQLPDHLRSVGQLRGKVWVVCRVLLQNPQNLVHPFLRDHRCVE